MNKCVYVTSRMVSLLRFSRRKRARLPVVSDGRLQRETQNVTGNNCDKVKAFCCMKLPAFGTQAEAGRFENTLAQHRLLTRFAHGRYTIESKTFLRCERGR